MDNQHFNNSLNHLNNFLKQHPDKNKNELLKVLNNEYTPLLPLTTPSRETTQKHKKKTK